MPLNCGSDRAAESSVLMTPKNHLPVSRPAHSFLAF
jgi:hypothetical protein